MLNRTLAIASGGNRDANLASLDLIGWVPSMVDRRRR